MSTNTTVVNTTVETEVARFGTGRYSALMEECHHDAMVIFRLSDEAADKLARNIANEVGAIMKNQPVAIRASKSNKDGKITLSEAAKIKGVTLTNPLMALRAMQWANEAVANGFSRKSTTWEVIPALKDYFAQLV